MSFEIPVLACPMAALCPFCSTSNHRKLRELLLSFFRSWFLSMQKSNARISTLIWLIWHKSMASCRFLIANSAFLFGIWKIKNIYLGNFGPLCRAFYQICTKRQCSMMIILTMQKSCNRVSVLYQGILGTQFCDFPCSLQALLGSHWDQISSPAITTQSVGWTKRSSDH